MKKNYLFLSIIGLLFLAGCSNSVKISTENNKEIELSDADIMAVLHCKEMQMPNCAEFEGIELTQTQMAIGCSMMPNMKACEGFEIPERNVLIEAKQWEFIITNKDSQAMNDIRVKKGEKVNLEANSLDVVHGIVAPALGVDMKFDTSTKGEASFMAAESGTYDYFCTVYCGKGHMQHKGKIIVEE